MAVQQKDFMIDVTDPAATNAEAKMSQPKIRRLWMLLTVIVVLGLVSAALIAYLVYA